MCNDLNVVLSTLGITNPILLLKSDIQNRLYDCWGGMAQGMELFSSNLKVLGSILGCKCKYNNSRNTRGDSRDAETKSASLYSDSPYFPSYLVLD